MARELTEQEIADLEARRVQAGYRPGYYHTNRFVSSTQIKDPYDPVPDAYITITEYGPTPEAADRYVWGRLEEMRELG